MTVSYVCPSGSGRFFVIVVRIDVVSDVAAVVVVVVAAVLIVCLLLACGHCNVWSWCLHVCRSEGYGHKLYVCNMLNSYAPDAC